jgi:hypothetical protein
MSTSIEATFDGKVFRPAGPVRLEPNTPVRLTIEPLTSVHKPLSEDYPEAEFYKPVAFSWTEFTYEVDQALKEYSEQPHADH